MAAQRLGAAPGQLGQELVALDGPASAGNAGPIADCVPARSSVSGAEAFHRQLGQHLAELPLEMANPAVGQDDVGVEDLARERMHPARADRRALLLLSQRTKL